MVERYIPGRELTCAVMGDVALGVTEIVTDLHFYNYEAKYQAGGSRHIVPAEISPKIYEKLQKMSLKAHAASGLPGRDAVRFPLQRLGAGWTANSSASKSIPSRA